MTEVTIIRGLPGEGKTKRALEIVRDKKVFSINYSDFIKTDYPFQNMDLDTEFIIIEDNWVYRFWEFVEVFSNKEKLRIDRKNSKTVFIPMPKIIFCINKIIKP
jgi:hypothetical protein